MKKRYLGIDLGGTNIKAVVLDKTGKILDKEKVATEDSLVNTDKWKLNLIDIINRKTKEFSELAGEPMKCGISAPGLTDKANKQILHLPEKLKGLIGINWSEELGRDIVIINDAHAACIAEYTTYYKGRIQNMLLLTLGTGVGGAAIVNGELMQGSIQRAGHFGHITVDHNGPVNVTNMTGSLEYAIGNYSVSTRTHGQFQNTKELVDAHLSGDSLASYWWLSSVQKLAVGLSSLNNSFSPEVIVLGGGMTNAKEALMEPLNRFMSLYEWRPGGHQVEINIAKFGDFSGAVGAAIFAKKR